MDTFGWGTEHPVGDWLYAEGHRFDFFQAVRLLEALHPTAVPVGEASEPAQEAVRFKAPVSLSFSGADVTAIAPPARPEEPSTVQAQVMGLAGVAGPLPAAYTEFIMDRERHRDTAFRDFLDIYNHRLLSLLYRVRKHHRLGFPVAPPSESNYARHLMALMGLGTDGLQHRLPIPDQALLRYAGLLSQRPRSSAGLRTMLRDFFGVPVEVVPCTGSWFALDPHQTTRLGRAGQNQVLGGGAVLGERVWSQQGGYEVHLGPLDLDAFLGFLPQGTSYRHLRALMAFYTDEQLEDTVVLRLKPTQVPRPRLGTPCAPRLGWTSWLYSAPPASAPGPVTLHREAIPPHLQRLRIPLFADLSPRAFSVAVGMLQQRTLPEGAVVVRQGDPNDSLLIVTQGLVQVLHDEPGAGQVVLATLKAGDLYGDPLRSTPRERLTTLVTVEPTELYELTHSSLSTLLERFPVMRRTLRTTGSAASEPLSEQVQVLERLLERLRIPLFQRLQTDTRHALLAHVQLRDAATGTVLAEQGKPARVAYYLVHGACRVDVHDPGGRVTTPRALQRGGGYGLVPLLRGTTYPSSLVSVSPVSLLALPAARLKEVARRYADLEHELHAYLQGGAP